MRKRGGMVIVVKAAFPVEIEKGAGKACGKVEQFFEFFSLAIEIVRK